MKGCFMNHFIVDGFIEEIDKIAGIQTPFHTTISAAKGTSWSNRFWDLLTKASLYGTLGLGIGTGSAVLTALGTLAKSKAKDAEVEQAYREIESDPTIKELIKENPRLNKEKARRAFDVLKKFAPDVAATPEVARPFVKHTLATGEGDVHFTEIKPLVDTQRIHEQNVSTSPVLKGLKEGFRGTFPVMQSVSQTARVLESKAMNEIV